MTNSMEDIADWITENFRIRRRGRLALYEIWPQGWTGWEKENVHLVNFSSRWPPSSKRESRPASAGILTTFRPTKNCTGGCSQQAAAGRKCKPGLFRSVQGLRPSASAQPSALRPHQEVRAPAEQTHRPGHRFQDAALEADTLFLNTLTPDDLRACSYHQASWKPIAEESVRILRMTGRADPEAYMDEVDRSPLPDTDKNWLW